MIVSLFLIKIDVKPWCKYAIILFINPKNFKKIFSIFQKFLMLIKKSIAYLHYRSISILIKNKDTIKLNIYFFAFMSYIVTLR